MIKTHGLTHINLLVEDIRRAKIFYQTVFGLEEMFWDGPHLVFLRPPGTQDTITLQQSLDARGVGNIDHFGFRLADKRDFDRAIEEVVAAGGTLIERGEHEPGRPFAYVADPDGHVIEL
jgi:catechol 2,3-dioxygenase-like lactoylglutathione lyase family enzyme